MITDYKRRMHIDESGVEEMIGELFVSIKQKETFQLNGWWFFQVG